MLSAAGIPLHVVGNGNLRKDAIDPAHRYASIPYYVRNPDGSEGMGRRQCTSEYKLAPIGRKVQSRVLSRGGPLIRVKPRDLFAAGIERVPRVVGVMDGLPMLADHRVLKVSNVIWCTGFHPDFSWIDLPGFGMKDPWHYRGSIPDQPGLYFVGLLFLYAMSSSMIHGVGRDAEYVANLIASRMAGRR